MFYGILTNYSTHVRYTTMEGSSHDHVLITWWLWLVRSHDWSCDPYARVVTWLTLDENIRVHDTIAHLKDPSLQAEVHRYRSVSGELDWLEQLLINLEAKWGKLAAQNLGAICRLEMANAMAQIEEVGWDEVDMEVHCGHRP